MGVVLPRITTHSKLPDKPYGPGDTTVALDEAVACFCKIVNDISELAQMTTSVWHLVNELHKTRRHINTLEYIFILVRANRDQY